MSDQQQPSNVFGLRKPGPADIEPGLLDLLKKVRKGRVTQIAIIYRDANDPSGMMDFDHIGWTGPVELMGALMLCIQDVGKMTDSRNS